MTLHDLTAPLRRRLAELRGRVRSLLMVHGTARVLVFMAVALVAYFLADFLLRLPIGVRAISLAVLLAGLGVEIYRHFVRPLAIDLDDGRLAAHVERAHPELKDRLCSSLAFTHAAEDPENEDSPELMRRVVEETVGLAGSIRFGAVARSRIPTRWAMLAVASMAVLISVSSIWPESFGTFLKRGLLLRDLDWPRRTTLAVAGMKPGIPRRVTLGRETVIRVRAAGRIPDRVSFTFWERGEGASRAETIELSPSAEDPSLFAFTLQVHTSYEFQVTGGDDDRGEVYVVESLAPPTILAIEIGCEYPAYLGKEPETLGGGDQRVPEGTSIRLSVRANMALSDAWVAFGDEEEQPMERVAEAVYAFGRGPFGDDVRYSIRLRGKSGEESDPRLDTFWIRVQRDQPPLVRIHTPAVRVDRVAAGVVLAGFTARDDHRLEEVRFHYRVDGGAPRTVVLDAASEEAIRLVAAPGRAPEHVLAVAAVELPRVRTDKGDALAKGSLLEFWVEATDSAGQKQRNRSDYRVELVAEEDVANDIETRQTSLRETVERALEHGRASVHDLETLRGIDPGDRDFRRWSGRAQAAQGRVIDDVSALAARLRYVINLYVFNRLDDRSSVDQILPYYERHLLTPSERTGDPFRGSLYRSLWTALHERAIRVSGSLAKLLEMADLTDRLATDEAPESYRILGSLGRPGTDEPVESALDRAAASQRRVTTALEQLDRLMREWQNFESVVRFFKDLRDTEQGLINDIESLNEQKD